MFSGTMKKKVIEGFLSDLANFSAFFEFKIFDPKLKSQFWLFRKKISGKKLLVFDSIFCFSIKFLVLEDLEQFFFTYTGCHI